VRSGRLTRRGPELALIAVLTLLFSSCATVEFQSEYFRDGTGEHALVVVIPRDQFVASEAAAFDEIATGAAAAGLVAERIDSPDAVTFRIREDPSEGDEAGARLNSLLNATGLNESPGISAPFQGTFQQEVAPVGGGTFELDLTIEGALLYDAIAALDVAAGTPRSELEAEIEISYQAIVPGDLESTTGTEVADDTLRWEVDARDVTSVQARTGAGDTGTAALFIAAAIASIAAAVVLAVFIGWMLVRRPRLASTISSAATHFPRRTTITREGVWVALRVRRYVERIWHRGAAEGSPPVRHDLMQSDREVDDDGPDAEGNRPAPGIHSR
jgi:hypothetical protein